MGRRVAGMAMVAGLALIAGCERGGAPVEADEINGADTNLSSTRVELPPEPVEAAPEEPRNEVKAVSNLADEAPPAEDVQMRDDADATGLTARMTPAEPDEPVDEAAAGTTADNSGQ